MTCRRPFSELGDQQLLDQTKRLAANQRCIEVLRRRRMTPPLPKGRTRSRCWPTQLHRGNQHPLHWQMAPAHCCLPGPRRRRVRRRGSTGAAPTAARPGRPRRLQRSLERRLPSSLNVDQPVLYNQTRNPGKLVGVLQLVAAVVDHWLTGIPRDLPSLRPPVPRGSASDRE